MGRGTKVRHPIDKCRAFDLVTEHGQPPRARVKCSTPECTNTSDHSLTKVGTPPNVIATWFRRDGWHVRGEGKKATCPECQNAKRLEKWDGKNPDASAPVRPPPTLQLAPEPTVKPEPQPRPEEPAILPPEPAMSQPATHADPPVPFSSDTFRKQRKVFQLLEEHFDIQNHSYRQGFSDESLSEQTGLSLAYVRQVREEAFGVLVDPVLKRLEDKIRATRSRYQHDRDDLVKRIEQLDSKYDAELKKIESQLSTAVQGRKV